MTAGVLPDRIWNTWDHRYPACFLHLPSGFAVRLCAYSSQADHYTDFDVDGGQCELVLGPHAADASYVQLELVHSGTRIRLEYAKRRWNEFVARIRILEQGELLFRNQLIVEAGFLWPDRQGDDNLGFGSPRLQIDLPDEEHAYITPTTAHAAWRSQSFCLELSAPPVGISTYGQAADVGRAARAEEWPKSAAAAAGRDRWAAFRFTGDRREQVVLALAQETDLGSGRRTASDLLAHADEIIASRARAAAAPQGQAISAVSDVMAWNTVADRVNSRVYTCLSRGWIERLGGWTIWLTDILYNALLSARAGDWEMARNNLDAVLAGQQPAGNLPCLMAGSQEWVDRTQLPIAAYITWRVYLLLGDRSMLERWYPALSRHYDWWFARRDGNGNGLLEYGSSPTGRAPYAHTKQAAVNESGMDNMSIFDDAEFDAETHTLRYEEVASNSLLVLEGQMLARMAAELGAADEAAAWQARADELAEKVRAILWDPERRLFAGRFWSGEFSAQLAPTIFFPLAAGIATEEQAKALITEHLLNTSEFWADELPLPSTPFNDPIAAENDYWRGRIWPPLNFFTWEGLRRYGYDDLASDLAQRSWRMFVPEWEGKRHCHENYHITDPAQHESPDSDVFYSWGALIPLMAALEGADFSPWTGLTLSAAGEAPAEISFPGRRLRARADGDSLVVSVNGAERCRVTPAARLSQVIIEDGRISFSLPAGRRYDVERPGGPPHHQVSCTVSGELITAVAAEHGLRFAVAEAQHASAVEIFIRNQDRG
jgi:putative isomerase